MQNSVTDNNLNLSAKFTSLVYAKLPQRRWLTHAVILLLLMGVVGRGGFRGLKLEPLRLSTIVPPHTASSLSQNTPTKASNRPVFQENSLVIPKQLVNYQTTIIEAIAPSVSDEGLVITPKTATKVEDVQIYYVQPGDTIFGIGLNFGLTPETILWANPTLEDNPDLLRLNQELTILPINGVYHQAVSGDTISSIAATYKVDPQTIIDYDLNKLNDDFLLTLGQQLIVPNGIKPYVEKRVSSLAVSAPSDALNGTGNFQWPVDGAITQEFWSRHRGLDIGAWQGAPVYAADSGYIAAAQWDDTGYGRMIIIDHGNGYKTLYGHLSVFFVNVGDEVSKGQQIANMGSTGNSTGPHLHFEMIFNGVKRNPWGFLP